MKERPESRELADGATTLKRWLIGARLVASVIWMAFAQFKSGHWLAIDDAPESLSAVDHVLSRVLLLLGFPLAALGAGTAIGWLLRCTDRQRVVRRPAVGEPSGSSRS